MALSACDGSGVCPASQPESKKLASAPASGPNLATPSGIGLGTSAPLRLDCDFDVESLAINGFGSAGLKTQLLRERLFGRGQRQRCTKEFRARINAAAGARFG